MRRLFQEITSLLREQQDCVVATIISSSGSSPRTAGAKMIVKPDGTIAGTIGGGRLEAEAISRSREVFRLQQGLVYPFSLKGEDVAGMDMICGGSGEVLLDYVDAGAENLSVLQAAVEALERGEKAWLLTFLDWGQPGEKDGRHGLLKPNGNMIGKVTEDAYFSNRIAQFQGVSIYVDHQSGRRVLAEPLNGEGTVYIFGAGHVSQKLVPVCESVGFTCVVLDDREEYANQARFTETTKVVPLETFQRLPDLPVDEDSYMVIVTRGHLHDEAVLAQALRTQAGYIGMIGSRRKRDKLYASLKTKGFQGTEFARVYSPIGLDIGAETPEEIAVSIAGELIKARAERRKSSTERGELLGTIFQ